MHSLEVWISLVLLLSAPSICLGGSNMADMLLNSIDAEINSLTQYPDNVDMSVDGTAGTISFAKSIGSTEIPQWITKTAFGYNRYFQELSDFQSYGSLAELEYDQRTSHPFAQLLWLPNLDRMYDIVQMFTTINIVNDRTASQLVYRKLEVGRCSLEYVGTEVTAVGNPTLTQLHFILYKNKTGNYLELDDSTKELSKISLMNSPSKVLVGAIILGGSEGFQMSINIANNITSLLGAELCDPVADFICCDEGASGTNSDGEPICTCTGNFFGACCNKECVNGHISHLPPHGSQICKCDYGWGGAECKDGNGSAAAHFVTKMNYEAKFCQNKVSQHWPYTYNGDLLVDSMNIATEANKVEIQAGTVPLTGIIYGTSSTHSTHNYYSSKTNDFLLGVKIPFGQTLSSTLQIIVKNELQTSVNEASTLEGVTNVRSCDVHYYIVHRNGTTGSLAEIFFVVGITGHSTFQSSQTNVFETSTTSTLISTVDKFASDGDKEGLLIGYTFVASHALSIPHSELRDVVNCYADRACDSLTDGCVHGAPLVVNGVVSCVCDEGFLGPSCKYPC